MVARGAQLPLWAGVYAWARVPQWILKPEDPHGANDLDSQARGREKGRGRWNAIYLRAYLSGIDTGWPAPEGAWLGPGSGRQRERRQHVSGAVLRFVREELQQRPRENGERGRAGLIEIRVSYRSSAFLSKPIGPQSR